MLARFAFTATSNICHAELGSIKMVYICSELLRHQEQPVFKLELLAIGGHRGIRDLGGLSVAGDYRRRLPVVDIGQLHGHFCNLVGIGIALRPSLSQLLMQCSIIILVLHFFLHFIHLTAQKCELSILCLELRFSSARRPFAIFKAIMISLVDKSEFLVQPLRLLRDKLQELLKGHHVLSFTLFSVNENRGSSVLLVVVIVVCLVTVGPRSGNGIVRSIHTGQGRCIGRFVGWYQSDSFSRCGGHATMVS